MYHFILLALNLLRGLWAYSSLAICLIKRQTREECFQMLCLCFRLCHNHLLPLTTCAYIFGGWFVGVFLTLSGYHCIHIETANDVTGLCFISSGHGEKQQNHYNSVQVPPLSGSTICCQGVSVKWILVQLKNKSKVYMYKMPQTWKTVSCVVCAWLYLKTISLCPTYGHWEEYSHIMTRIDVFNSFRIWVIFPWHSFGSEWSAELSRVAVVPADLKTLQSEQRTRFSQGLGGLVLIGQDFFIRVVYPSDW